MMKVRTTPWLLLNLLTSAEEIGKDLLKVTEMLLHILSVAHPRLIKLLSEEESIGE